MSGTTKNIFIEGCIGEGKSTLCKHIVNKLFGKPSTEVKYFGETVDPVLLEAFYSNQLAIMPTFQTSMITSRLSQKIASNKWATDVSKGHSKNVYAINDTGFFSDEVFIKTGMEFGNIDVLLADSLLKLKEICYRHAESAILKPTHVIMISSSPEKCLQNISQRSQVDKEIPLEYLRVLHKNYMDAYEAVCQSHPDINFVLLDTESGFADVDEVIKLFL